MAFVLLAVGDLITSVAISTVKAMVIQYINDEQKYQTTDVKSKLQELKGYLTQIETAISAAEKKEVKNNPGLAEWLADLKDAVYDAEDVFDAADYRVLADEAEKTTHQLLPQEEKKGKSKVQFLNIRVPNFQKVKKHVGTVAKRLLFLDEELNELIDVVDRIKNLVSNMPSFLQAILLEHQNVSAPTMPNEIPDWRVTTSESAELKVFGRDTEIQNLIKMVKGTSSSEPESESDEMNYSLISIVAMGGMGKTTLAQSVFNHEDLDNKFFDVKAWVCVSQNFDTRNIIIQLVEYISKDKGIELRGCRNWTTIEKALEECLEGKKFLIVLDDIWDDVKTKWETLSKPFRFGKYGSKVIVTTRDEKVLTTVKGSKEIFNLEKLEENSFWEFFKQYAFGTSKPANKYAILEDIGKQIASKLDGSPLAAKVIGRLLNSELNETHWTKIMKSKLWKVDSEENGILGALKLSYDHLPSHLKQCFGYLSLFPQGYVFRKDELTYTWMALGYVHSNDDERPEDVAKAYIDQLKSRCFLQKQQQEHFFLNVDDDEASYVIHDLLHSFATSIYQSEVHRVEDCSGVIPERVRHLFVSSGTLDNILKRVPNIKKLRSFVLMSKESQSLSEETLRKLIKSLRVLILLEVDNTLAERLSQTISAMVHLRYLGCNFKCHIPESIYKLHHLQAILFYPEYLLYEETLPNGLSKIFNFRYLDDKRTKGISRISGFGQLTLLQKLRSYEVSQEEGCMINELKNLRQIRGSLTIEGLDKVRDEAQARAAKLDNKEHIKNLVLIWGPDYEIKLDDIEKGLEIMDNNEKVLEGLRPHSNLKALDIYGYEGAKCPSWLNQTWLSNLETFKLSAASLEVLHPLGQFSRLKLLSLQSFTLQLIGVEIYGKGETTFPFLVELEIEDLGNLTEWSAAKDGQHAFPRLKKAIIRYCPNLSRRVGFLNSPKEFKIGDADSGAKLELEIDNMTVLIENIHHLACIHKLRLSRSEITTEHEQVFQNLVSLKELMLHICFLTPLDDAEGVLKHLTSLEELKINYCPSLSQLPKLPPSLKKLSIVTCWKLSERYDWRRYGKGKYWHEISHIPTIEFDGEILSPSALLERERERAAIAILEPGHHNLLHSKDGHLQFMLPNSSY